MANITAQQLIPLILYGGLLIILIICTVIDLSHHRIPNQLTCPTLLVALLMYSLNSGVDGLLFSLSGAAMGFVVFFLPYLMGAVGAGDVKLMTAVGAVLGFHQTVAALLLIALAGGGLALGHMLYRGTAKETFSRMVKMVWLGLTLVVHRDPSLLQVDKKKLHQDGIPFAVAITAGVYLFFILLLVNKEILSVLVG
ncbi:MAG: prepilin peptidase [Candidatus Electrothrix sp. ATG2]|nr:prepilin peptidase [Candidatus Electrothrix sp. ATG2]